MPLFDQIVGQDLALAIMRQALATGPVHAYLFAGPRGVGKADAALEFAAALCCPEGGCGECDTCRRVREGIHPDVEVVAPEGSFVLVDQIREINRDIALRPFEAKARVYVMLQAESMNKEAANAFLKTLEEPPPHAYMVLVSDAADELLPTIVSRCQRVPFSRTPTALLARHLAQAYELTEFDAQAFARVAQGDLAYGRSLASSPAARAHRAQVLEWARRVPEDSLLDVELMIDELMASVDARATQRVQALDGLRERALEWSPDARSRARVEKAHEQRVKRERRRAVAEGLDEAMRSFAGWYRDLAAVAAGADDAVLNYDYLFELQTAAFPGMLPGYLAAVGAVRRAMRRFRYNVDTRCTLEDMVLAMKEALP
jgi:DNA polymerase III subunit delta'